MQLAKGLEFRLVIAMACDETILPAQDRTMSSRRENNAGISMTHGGL
jgi:superfamily I DNA/RNA helicase